MSFFPVQNAVGFWTLADALALTGYRDAKSPVENADDLFATALVIAWLQQKHSSSEDQWRLVVQKARTWLKKRQITLKLQGTDFLSIATAFVQSKK